MTITIETRIEKKERDSKITDSEFAILDPLTNEIHHYLIKDDDIYYHTFKNTDIQLLESKGFSV